MKEELGTVAQPRVALTVVVMVFNEELSLAGVVEEILRTARDLGTTFEVIIVDDGSTDGTSRVAADLADREAEVRVVTHEVNQGLGGVYRTGFTSATGDYVTFFPADGQFSSSCMKDFLSKIADHDLVLGYLDRPRISPIGRFLSFAERLLYQLVIGRIPRFQGIFMVRRRLLQEIEIGSSGRGWAVVMELIIKADRRGYRIGHQRTGIRARKHGRSKVTNVRTVAANARQMLGLRRHLNRSDRVAGRRYDVHLHLDEHLKLDASRVTKLGRQRRLFAQMKQMRLFFVLAGLAAILFWQVGMGRSADAIDGGATQRAASGMHEEDRFLYFLYYLNLFPVATEVDDLEYSREGALKLVEERGESLLTEVGHTMRGGDLLRTYLFLPAAWIFGPEDPNLRLFHGSVFILALFLLFLSLCWVRQPVLAIMMPLLLGSHSLQVHEVWVRENVFSWPISVAVLLLALHVPIIFRRLRSNWYLWGVVLVSAVLIGVVKELRTEAAIAGIGVIGVYLFCVYGGITKRLAMVGCLIVVALGVNRSVQGYLNYKWSEAKTFVREAGGHPYPGPRTFNHAIWHPIWCGLGDYGGDRGYEWKDQVAHAYAEPILRDKYNVDVPELVESGDQVYRDSFWDPGKKYYKVTSELPYYNEVVRDKVLSDISEDPLWYGRILIRRFLNTMLSTAPIRIQWPGGYVDLPFPGRWGIVLVPLFVFLLWSRQMKMAQLLLFSLPLSVTAIVIYSGNGMTYFSIFPQIMVSIFAAWLVEIVLGFGRTRQGDGPQLAGVRPTVGQVPENEVES